MGLLGRGFKLFNEVFERATKNYTESVRRAIRRSVISLGVFGAIVVAGAFLIWQRPTGFLPEDDQGYLLMVVQLPAAASLHRSEMVLGNIREIVKKQP